MINKPTVEELRAIIANFYRGGALDDLCEIANNANSSTPVVDVEMNLCEIPWLILREGITYRFSAAPGCKKCYEYSNPPKKRRWWRGFGPAENDL